MNVKSVERELMRIPDDVTDQELADLMGCMSYCVKLAGNVDTDVTVVSRWLSRQRDEVRDQFTRILIKHLGWVERELGKALS